MTTDQEQLGQQIAKIIEASPYNSSVGPIYLFGSYARGDQNDDSDIDLLVTLKKPMGYDFMDLENILSDGLQKSVDLVTKDGVSPYILPYIEKQKVLIYE